MFLFLTPDQYNKPLDSCVAVVFISYCFNFFIFSFFFFIRLLDIIIDLVFTFSYHATLKINFWCSDRFYPFCFLIYNFEVKKGLHKYLIRLTYGLLMNILWSSLYVYIYYLLYIFICYLLYYIYCIMMLIN